MSVNRKVKFFESLDVQTRRNFLKAAAMAGVSSSMIFSNSNNSLAAGKEEDAKIMNVALGLEHQAIAAYHAGANTKLLSAPVLVLAVKFLNDHKRHRDKLAENIKKFGGKPVNESSKYDVVAIAKGVGVEELKAEADIIKLAARLEEQATKAYLGIVASFESAVIIKETAQIAADEATHTAILKGALNEFADSKSYL